MGYTGIHRNTQEYTRIDRSGRYRTKTDIKGQTGGVCAQCLQLPTVYDHGYCDIYGYPVIFWSVIRYQGRLNPNNQVNSVNPYTTQPNTLYTTCANPYEPVHDMLCSYRFKRG